ncbi:MAG: hypothetical protein QM770_08545 [Tepidisphaeraceae bacterium]
MRIQLGQELAHSRMHATLRQIYHGWARIFAGTSGRKPRPMLAVLAFIVLCVLTLPVGLALGLTSMAWLVASLAHAFILFTFLALAYSASGHSPLNAFLLPVTLPAMMSVLIYAIRACSAGSVEWRGSSVNIE